MADEKKIIEIKVDNDAAVAEIVRLREEVTKLNSQEGLTREEQEKNKIATKEYNDQIRSLQKEVQNSIKTDKAKEGSLQQMKAQLSNLTKEYNNLSKEERESAKGTELRDKIRGLSDELKANESAVGLNQRKVGDYAGELSKLPGPLGAAATGVKTLSVQLKALLANPVVAVMAAIAVAIGAVVAIFSKMSSVIKSNEEQSTALAVAMAPLRVIGDAVTRVFEGMADTFIKVAGGIAGAITKFTDWIGLTEGATEKTKEYIDVEQSRLRLAEQTRTTNELIAKNELQVAKLRADIARKDKFSVQERLDMNRRAVELERKNADERVKIAKENLRLLEIEDPWTKNSAEFNDKLSQARVAVDNADREYFQNIRRLETQTAALVQEIQADTLKIQEASRQRAEADAAQRAQRANDEIINERAKQMLLDNTIIEAEERRAKLVANVRAKALTSPDELNLIQQRAAIEMDAEIRLQQSMYDGLFELQRWELEKQYTAEIAAAEKVGADTLAITELYEKQKTEIKRLEVENSLALASGFMGNIAEIFGENTKVGKMAASAQVAIDSIKGAISAYSSLAGVPVVGPALGAVAAGAAIAAGVKAIKNIWAVKSGLPRDSGSGGGSARLSSVTPSIPDTTSRIGSVMSGASIGIAGGSAGIASAPATSIATGNAGMMQAMQNMPAPIVTVKDIEIAQNRVRVVDNLSKI